MRDPKRIEEILELIKEIWGNAPDLRLTQLIMNALNMNGDPYYIEDTDLLISLKKFNYKRGRQR